jgi:hypothetical protein
MLPVSRQSPQGSEPQGPERTFRQEAGEWKARLRHEDASVREVAIEALPDYFSGPQTLYMNSVKMLLCEDIVALAEGEPAAVRAKALVALPSLVGESQALELLLQGASADAAEVREAAARTLAPYGRKYASRVPPALVKAVGDSEAPVRAAAIVSLRWTDQDLASGAVPALALALGDPDEVVRREAVATLRWLGPDAEAAVPGLVGVVLSHAGGEMAGEAMQALQAADSGRGVAFARLASVEDAGGRGAILGTLRTLGPAGRDLRRALEARWNAAQDARAGSEPEAPGGRSAATGNPLVAVACNDADSSWAAPLVTPVGPQTQDRTITISSGETGYSLQRGGGQPVSIPVRKWWKPIFATLITKVFSGSPTECVDWKRANAAVERDEVDASSVLLRDKLSSINAFLRERLGTPPDGGMWLMSRKRQGVQLNPSVGWQLSDKLEKELGAASVYAHSVDTRVLAETRQDHGQKMPAQPQGGEASEGRR